MEKVVIPLDFLKRCIREKIMFKYNMDLSNKSRDKSWENIANDWKEFSHRSRKEAMDNVRLKTRHNCLAEHLKIIGTLIYSLCPICKTGTMNREHLLVCSGLDRIIQLRGDACLLHWRERDLMS
ncbi:hypothetical protein NPIL_483711 [Nephila pilipes]|uniref:Uncharacterized protein n=1 Tax=Nephila pilipes TaxID=299642 RepID=A0A8X6QZZ1_NEPPI|nr:hypothetical protein NPIL_483711 [Nephila pilipes]